MTLVSANHISKSFGARFLFRDVSFLVPRGGRIGLIGSNGCGKTTLFRIVEGSEDHDGEVSRRRGLKITRLEQSASFPAGVTPRRVMTEAVGRWRELDRDMDRIREELPGLAGRDLDSALRRLADLEARRTAGGGDSAVRRAETMLRGVGIRLDQFDQDAATLSGGERCRVALARLLLEEPDLWLLDEPTNHLDLDGIAFLERFLKKNSASAIVVSHDRRFLDQVTDTTWELENGELRRYPGNYTQSRAIREERRTRQWREFMKQRDFLQREEAFISKWRAGTRSRQAQSRMKRLAKLDLADQPQNQARLAALNLRISRRLGDIVLETSALEIGYPGKRLAADLGFELRPGEILGVVGPNGAGKTTLFRTLLGAVPPLSGSFRWGRTAEIGCLGQHETFPDPGRTPLQFLQDANLGEDDQDRRDRLGAMLFSGDDVFKPIASLSGGEKKRLMLTRLLLEGHNVLLLDEPTNHLDIQSSEAVTLALAAYPGTVLVISHDRYFLDEAADRVLWLEDGGPRLTNGGFTEALAAREQAIDRVQGAKHGAAAAHDPSRGKAPRPPRAEAAGDRLYAKWPTRKLEDRIIANEDRMGEILAAFSDPATARNGNRMRLLQNELAAIEDEQAGLEEEYGMRG